MPVVKKESGCAIKSFIPMKVMASAAVSASLLMSAVPFAVAESSSSKATAEIVVEFEGRTIELPKQPVERNGTVMLPARAVLEGFGYVVRWHQEDKSVTAVRSDGSTLNFQIDNRVAEAEQKLVELHPEISKPYLENDLTWVPLQLLESLDGLTIVRSSEGNNNIVIGSSQLVKNVRVVSRGDHPAAGQFSPALNDYFEKKWGMDFKLEFSTPSQHRDRTNLRIAAGDIPELMLIENPYSYDPEMLQSLFIDITDRLRDYPNLKELLATNQQLPGSFTINDRIYSIPRLSYANDAPFPVLRQDWMQLLELDLPETMDELYEALQLLVHSDPDGDGKHNTIGLTGITHSSGLGSLSWVEQVFTGSTQRFSVVEGEVIDHAVSEEQISALTWLTNAYADGILDKEFALHQPHQMEAKIREGKVAVTSMKVSDAARYSTNQVEGGSEGLWTPIPGLRTEDSSLVVPWNSLGNGSYFIPVNADNETVDRLLGWLDEGLRLSREGQWEETAAVSGTDLAVLENVFGFSNLSASSTVSSVSSPDSLVNQYREAITSWENAEMESPGWLPTDLIFSKGDYAELNAELTSRKVAVIVGSLSVDEWRKYIDNLQQSDEYQEMMGRLSALVE